MNDDELFKEYIKTHDNKKWYDKLNKIEKEEYKNKITGTIDFSLYRFRYTINNLKKELKNRKNYFINKTQD